MVAGAPLSAMASEVNAADQAGETAVVAESADSADETEVDAGIASQDQNDASQDPVVNGVDPMSLDGVIQLDDGNWYYFKMCIRDRSISLYMWKSDRPGSECGNQYT